MDRSREELMTERMTGGLIPLVLTGSQVYGPYNPGSDIDIVLLEEDIPDLQCDLKDCGIEWAPSDKKERYPGGYFSIGPLVFNIIVVANLEELVRYRKATDLMKIVSPILDRDVRIEMFQRYKTE